MPNPYNLLDVPFQDALARAATLDHQGITPGDNDDGLFTDHVPTNVELVKACIDFYQQNRAMIDGAVGGALKVINSTHGVAQVKALQGSFESPEPNPLSVDLASRILSDGEFESALTDSTAQAQAQALQGFGVGVSAEVSAFIGLLGGADVVFDFQDKAEVHGRTWVGGSIKGGLSLSGGLELSLWFSQPTTGAIAGWLIDLYIPTDYVVLLFVRFMYIKQRKQGTKEFTFSGVSLQFPLGIGLPVRNTKEKDAGVVALFAGKQAAFDRNKRATLEVVNTATDVNTIAVAETTTLAVSLKNTSGNAVSLSAGATMTISMPAYFSDDDVSNMSIALEDWAFATDGGKLTLTLSEDLTWQAGEAISFDITNVSSSSKPPNQESAPGSVKMNLSDSSFSQPIVCQASFYLVWENSEATLNWQVGLSDDFTLDGEASGSVVAYAQPGNEIVQLTTATDSGGNVWMLGYVYNYNTSTSGDAVPQVFAAWWKEGSPKLGNNYFEGNKVTKSGETSTCYFGELETSGSQIAIKVTFSSN